MDMLVKECSELANGTMFSFGTQNFIFYTCNLWKYMIILRGDIKEEGN